MMDTFMGPSWGMGRTAFMFIVWPGVYFWTLALLSAKVAPRQRSSLQSGVAADMSMSSRGVVGSATAGVGVRLG